MTAPSNPAPPDPYYELFERSADAILIIENEQFVDCNRATVEMLRYRSKEELLRTHPSELSPPTQPDGRGSYEKANEMMALAFARGSHRFEWDHMRRDGGVFPVEVLLTAVQRDGRQILHVVWRDITARKQLEEQLRHAQKIEAVGKLAGGVAHDFNNVLVAIIGNGELLRRGVADRPELVGYADELLAAGNRAARLVRQLLTFSRRQETPTAVLDLMPVVREVESMLVRLIGEHIQLRVEGPEAPLPVRANRGRLEQVFLNLVTNARDAMPNGGTIVVELKQIALPIDGIDTGARLPPGPYAMIAVSDTGHGMSDEVRARAIDPFFTTKEVGAGTGLGLSTVYGIARDAGGELEIETALGRGTTVRVLLPLRCDAQLSDAEAARPRAAAGGSERILVVEDDDGVARVVIDALGAAGYRVRRARHGAEALEMVLDAHGEIDLIVSDVVMPRMGGATLVEQLRARGIETRVLFMSGHANDALSSLAGLGEDDLLEKPFTATELATRVRRILDRDRS